MTQRDDDNGVVAAVRELCDFLGSSRSPREGLKQLLEFGRAWFGLPLGLLTKVERERFSIELCQTPPNTMMSGGDQLDSASTFANEVVQTGAPVLIASAGESQYRSHPAFTRRGQAAYFGTPVFVRGRLWGTLDFFGPEPLQRQVDPGERELLRMLAAWAGSFVEREVMARGRDGIADDASPSDKLVRHLDRALTEALRHSETALAQGDGQHQPAALHDIAAAIGRAAELTKLMVSNRNTAANSPDDRSAAELPPRTNERAYTALIIEDATTIRTLLVQVLERAGFTVLTAADGIEGLEALERGQPDLVIVDLQMPRMDGETALREIRARGSRVPVIVSSGFLDDETRRRLEGLQAECLRKPYGAEVLVRLATRMLRKGDTEAAPAQH